ncbi:MAG TPA: response regulator [Pyrinomonadaceae bacterium]|nr:response regulator [Pyrinomonadaceae bacterium]
MLYADGDYFSRYTSQAAAVKTQKETPTVLIAEDSRDGREMLQVLLGLKGYAVLTVGDGKSAVEVALESLPDLILLDLELPGLDGLSVARKLRCHSNCEKVPIIILSGHDPMEHKQSALDAGCTDYLLKPVDFRKLDEILEHEVPL